jgi:hypothetical protein
LLFLEWVPDNEVSAADSSAAGGFDRDGRVSSRSCWISLRESDRPVPS